MIKALTLTLSLFLLIFSVPSHAQEGSYLGYLEQLNTINKADPQQSPNNERTQDVLKDRVLDSNNQVIGEVRDVILGANGDIAMLDVEFDRLKIGTDRLSISYNEMQVEPAGNGYKLGLSKDQMVDMFPSLLAGIATASGEHDALFSVDKMQGAIVRNERGRKVGIVEDVLFSRLGAGAKYLYIKTGKGMRAETVAVPFAAASYEMKGRVVRVTLNENLGQAVKDYAKN